MDYLTLNIKLLLNEEFRKACEQVYSPRNAFCISRNDGKMNPSVNIFKDTVIVLNGLLNISRDQYSKDQLLKIQSLKDRYKEVV